MKLKNTILCFGLIGTLLLSTSSKALATTTELPSDNVSETRVPDDEIPQLEKELFSVSPLASDDNVYEPNDTIGTAFPYANTKKIECGGDKDGDFGHYNCFYTPNWITSEDDIDYFKVNLQVGEYYVAVLKNVWSNQIRDLRLYYQKSDGSWWYKHPRSKDRGQSIMHFTAEYNTYYIRISGSTAPGYTDGSGVNWFAVERDGTIDERLLPYDSKPAHALK